MSLVSLRELMNPQNEILAQMLRGYVECFLWCEGPRKTADDDQSYTAHGLDLSDISDELAKQIILDCADFYAAICLDIPLLEYLINHDDWSSVGHDFWLTRNGHGAGFWDGEHILPYETQLTDMSKNVGTMELYLGDDGHIYGT